MLGLFLLLMSVLVGYCVYGLSLYIMRKIRGEESSNKTASIIIAVLSGLGFCQWLIGYCH